MSSVTSPSDELAAVVSEVEALLRPLAKFKARSHDTSKSSHIPLLRDNHPDVVLLGDSMLERMSMTGQPEQHSLSLVAPWPASAMFSDRALSDLAGASHDPERQPQGKVERLQRVLNAGVGGDKIQNIAYRLLGNSDPDPAKNLPGLASAFAARKSVKLWVVQAGTNNLSPKKGLTDADRDAMRVVLRCLLKTSSLTPGTESKVLLTGLFPRTDISNQLVDNANEKLEGVAQDLNAEYDGKERVIFLPATEKVKTDRHLVDHVHLSLEGYTIWMKELFPAVLNVLQQIEEENTGDEVDSTYT
ncbi:SGNH hydrolase-type esterase domain-containing protein [Podospora didyma]|uniref:SGNH hydrolase-type esterase domain-containing protein n=1 Tax=Podospora didyma TaxID=330526 RepID=A0AAE0NBH7_9PEZI|nr:SGNH hydrolase-type esterase domain-containing protein [Podospora didyma]